MKRWLLLLFALGTAACKEPAPVTAVHNECFAEKDCEHIARCDHVLLKCVRAKTDEPYDLFVRIAAPSNAMLADGGIVLVPQVVQNLGAFSAERDAEILHVPQAVPVSGSVILDGDGRSTLLSAQVMFVPRDAMVPLASTVVETRYADTIRDSGVPHLQTMLNPELHYDVQTQPLLASSSTLPPMEIEDVGTSDLNIRYTSTTYVKRSGKFVYRGEPARADSVRLQERLTGRIVSSTALVVPTEVMSDGPESRQEGVFDLWAQEDVFERGNFDLVIGLADFPPWQVTIAIEGSRFLEGSEMFLPRVPSAVRTSANVEDSHLNRLPHTDVLFLSRYPLPPDDSGSAPPSFNGTDWCRWEDPARIACSGRFQSRSDETGKYDVDLIPGQYDVMILPTGPGPAGDLMVSSDELAVSENAGIGGEYLMASDAIPYTGTVLAGGIATANVTMHALPRPTPRFSTWGLVADFNQYYSEISDPKGHFELPADVGYYDFVAEPEPDTGFPWKLWLDCPNGPGAGGALVPIRLSTPVMILGAVEIEDSGVRVPNAQIEAFTIVERTKPEDGDQGEPRSVMIGRAVSNDKGEYILALPPTVGERERMRSPCESAARIVKDSAPATR